MVGEADVVTLSLPGPTGAALHFAERPGHDVGLLSIDDHLMSIVDAETDPPNAAPVASPDHGGELQAVVELMAGDVDAAGAVTLRVRLLGMANDTGISLEEDARADLTGPIALGIGPLFIDGLEPHKDNPTCGSRSSPLPAVGP